MINDAAMQTSVLSSIVWLLINPLKNTPGYSAPIIDKPLRDCRFQDMYISGDMVLGKSFFPLFSAPSATYSSSIAMQRNAQEDMPTSLLSSATTSTSSNLSAQGLGRRNSSYVFTVSSQDLLDSSFKQAGSSIPFFARPKNSGVFNSKTMNFSDGLTGRNVKFGSSRKDEIEDAIDMGSLQAFNSMMKRQREHRKNETFNAPFGGAVAASSSTVAAPKGALSSSHVGNKSIDGLPAHGLSPSTFASSSQIYSSQLPTRRFRCCCRCHETFKQ
jgi:hypothetical protein